MAKPFPIVEISFAGTPYDASPAWVDVSSYVRSVTTHRGRSGDTEFETGTAQVVLDNRSRLFDPFYTGGTYYGLLIPRKQIRVRSTIGATTYDVFRGYITGWPVQYTEAGFDSTVTLQCYDAFGLLNDDHLPEDWSRYTIENLSPITFIPANDAEGKVLTDRGSNKLNLAPQSSNRAFTEFDSLGEGLVGTSANLIGNLYSNTSTFSTATSGDITILFWYALSQPTSASVIVNYYSYDGASTNRIKIIPNTALDVGSLGSLEVDVRQGTPVARSRANTSASLGLNTFAPNHVAMTYTKSSGAVQIYINGVSSGTQTLTTSGINFVPTGFIELNDLIVQDLAVFSSVLSAANILAIYSVGASNVVESTSTRAARVLATTSFPAGLIDTYPTTVYGECAEITNGGSIVPELNLIGATEGGYFFVTKAGKVKMTDRQYVFSNTNSNTTQATFSDVIPYVNLKYGTSLSLEYNSDDIGNVATVNLSGGGEVSSTNSTSVTSFGRKAYTIATQSSTVAGAQTLADWDVTLRSKLRATVSPIEVSVTSASADWSTLLGLELLERFVVTRTPSVQIGQGTPTATGNAITQTMLINAIDHSITPGDWTMTLTGSTRYTGYFILDKSVLDGTDVLF